MNGVPIPVELTIQEAEGPITFLLLPPTTLVRMHLGDSQGARQHLLLFHDEREIRLMTVACLFLDTLRHGRDQAVTETAMWLVGLVELQST